MASLVVCPACRRHVRSREPRCPFCGAERKPTAGASREGTMAGDATRATLIALGLTLVGQACGGDAETSNERDGVGLIPPYGLGPFPDDTGGGGDGGSGGAAGSGGRDPGPTVPPYGAMPPPEPGGGSGGDAETPDSGAPPDAGGDDAGASETPDAGD